MPFNRSFLALAATAALTLGSTACVVSWTDEPIADDDNFFFDDDATSVSSGTGGDATTTGAGGDETSTGGTGGTDTTSTGVGGGDPYCVDGEGTGETEAICETLAIAPNSAGICSDGFNALGYDACVHSFEIWEGGFAEALTECLSYIPAEDACDEQLVLDCVADLYIETCDVPFIEQSCQSWSNTCSEGGDSLDAAQCYSDITPFNDDGILQLTDCMNATDGTCQEAYDYCFEEVTAF